MTARFCPLERGQGESGGDRRPPARGEGGAAPVAVRTLASLPSPREQGQEVGGQGAQPSRPAPTSGVRRQLEPVATPTPCGLPRLAFPRSEVQWWILDSVSRRPGGDGSTWGWGWEMGGEKGQRGLPAGTSGRGPLREGAQGPQTALLASVGPGASRTGSGLPPAGVVGEEGARPPPNLQPPAGTPRPCSLPTAPRKPSGSPLLHCSERRSSDPPAADLRLTPSPLSRFLPPVPSALSTPVPGKNRQPTLVPASPSETGPLSPETRFPSTCCPGHTRWTPGGGARGRGGVLRPQYLCWEKGVPLDEAEAAHHGPGHSQRLPPASCCWTSAPGAWPHPCPSPRLCPVARPSLCPSRVLPPLHLQLELYQQQRAGASISSALAAAPSHIGLTRWGLPTQHPPLIPHERAAPTPGPRPVPTFGVETAFGP